MESQACSPIVQSLFEIFWSQWNGTIAQLDQNMKSTHLADCDVLYIVYSFIKTNPDHAINHSLNYQALIRGGWTSLPELCHCDSTPEHAANERMAGLNLAYIAIYPLGYCFHANSSIPFHFSKHNLSIVVSLNSAFSCLWHC